MTDSQLREALLAKLRTSRQALYQRAARVKRAYGPMTTEDAIYWIAVDEGFDLSKFLDRAAVDRIRGLRSGVALHQPVPAGGRSQLAGANVAPRPTRQTMRTPGALFDVRSLHQMVVRSSRKLFVDGHRSEAIRRAFQRVNNRVKKLAGSTDDGQPLMSKAFSEKKPALQMTDLATDSQINEHNGTRFLMMGAMTGLRNPRAHEDRWEPDNDISSVLDTLSFASLLHRLLDRCEAYQQSEPATGRVGRT